jgi:hypothetical protein
MTTVTGSCEAISQDGTPVTGYVDGRIVLTIARPRRYFICTQDHGHTGSHAAWPRSAAERYWQPGDCDEHGHEVTR